MSSHEKIDYVELPASNISANKKFFEQAFGWQFEDYGEEYTAFTPGPSTNGGIEGGFYKSDKKSVTSDGSALVVFLSERLEETQQKIIDCGGTIVQEIFSFPGGRRFHFTDPSGNEYAVWTKT